jgi:hypothetical protein
LFTPAITKPLVQAAGWLRSDVRRFTEGFDTLDLKEAKKLLDELAAWCARGRNVFTPGGSRIGSRADADVVDLEAPETDDPSIVEPIELAASAAYEKQRPTVLARCEWLR